MTNSTGNDVCLTRSLPASIEQVWKMWVEPEQFAGWYGPPGATIPVANIDAQVGGSRLICMEMQTPDGPMQMWFTGEFTEISAPTRLVYTDGMSDENGKAKTSEEMGMPAGQDMSTEVIVELTDAGDSTELTLTHVGVPADSPGGQGWAMALDKLASSFSAG